MSGGVSSKGSVPSDYEFSMYNVYCTNLKWVENDYQSYIIPSDFFDYFVPIVLKPLSAECHVVMDQSSDIVLDTPKVKLCTISHSFYNVITVIKNNIIIINLTEVLKKGYYSTVIKLSLSLYCRALDKTGDPF